MSWRQTTAATAKSAARSCALAVLLSLGCSALLADVTVDPSANIGILGLRVTQGGARYIERVFDQPRALVAAAIDVDPMNSTWEGQEADYLWLSDGEDWRATLSWLRLSDGSYESRAWVKTNSGEVFLIDAATWLGPRRYEIYWNAPAGLVILRRDGQEVARRDGLDLTGMLVDRMRVGMPAGNQRDDFILDNVCLSVVP